MTEEDIDANEGEATAYFYLGLEYYNGIGVPVDRIKGIELLKKSANQGNCNAQQYLKEIELQ